MALFAVDNRHFFHTLLQSLQRIIDLGDHATRDDPRLAQLPNGDRIDGRNQLAVGIEHTVDVGEVDQAAGGQSHRHPAGYHVGIDVVSFATLADPDGCDDRNETALRQGVYQIRIDQGHLAHVTWIDDLRRRVFVVLEDDVEFFGLDQPAVLAGEAYRLAALAVDLGHDGLVDLAPQHHFDHVHGRGIGQAHAFNKGRLDAHLEKHGVDLRPSAVHHHRVEPDKLQQGDVTREILLELVVHHGVTTVLDHDGHPRKAPDIRQRFDEYAGNLFVHGQFIPVPLMLVLSSSAAFHKFFI